MFKSRENSRASGQDLRLETDPRGGSCLRGSQHLIGERSPGKPTASASVCTSGGRGAGGVGQNPLREKNRFQGGGEISSVRGRVEESTVHEIRIQMFPSVKELMLIWHALILEDCGLSGPKSFLSNKEMGLLL